MTEFSALEIEDIINEYFRESTYAFYKVEEGMDILAENLSYSTGDYRYKLPLFLLDHLTTLMEISSSDADIDWVQKSHHTATTYTVDIRNTIQLLETHLKNKSENKTYKEFKNSQSAKVPNAKKTLEHKVEAFKSHAKSLLMSMGHPPYTKPKTGVVDLAIALSTAGRPQEQIEAINSLYHMIENTEDYIQHGKRNIKKGLSSIDSLKIELKKLHIPKKEERINIFIEAVKTELL